MSISAVLCGLLSATVQAAPADVAIRNQTRPTTCAEEDNVTFTLSQPNIKKFRIEALQPPYLDTLRTGNSNPDFSGCNFTGRSSSTDSHHTFKPREKILFDNGRSMIVGVTQSEFWRPNQVPVMVGNQPESGFHLLQFYRKTAGKWAQIVVLYPADGYWRLKPLPASRLGENGFGASFLVGPIEDDSRPLVDIASIDIVPVPLTIRLTFTRGGHATVVVRQVNVTRTALDVALAPATGGQPFAMLRSMYVTPENADVSEVTWQPPGQVGLVTEAVPKISAMRAMSVRFGRSVQSRHNPSAPDIEFSHFVARRLSPKR